MHEKGARIGEFDADVKGSCWNGIQAKSDVVLHVSCIRDASLQALSKRCTDPTLVPVKMPSITERYENAAEVPMPRKIVVRKHR